RTMSGSGVSPAPPDAGQPSRRVVLAWAAATSTPVTVGVSARCQAGTGCVDPPRTMPGDVPPALRGDSCSLSVSTPRASRSRLSLPAVMLGIGALIVLRSWVFLQYEQADFDADQAIVGLMAKHLSEGRA